MKRFFEAWILAVAVLGTLAGFSQVFADTYTGTSWKINGAFGNSTGGITGGGSYNLVEASGESVIGNGSGGSYTMTAGYVSQLQNSAIQLTLQPIGLVGYWPMEETRGTSARDMAINGNNALLYGSPAWSIGKVGGGLALVSANSQYAEMSNIAALQTNTVTASGWFKTNTTVTGQTIIAKSGAWQIAISRSTAGKLAIHNQAGDVDVCVDTTTVNDDAWHYVAMVMDSGVTNGTKLYVDGALKQTCTATVQNQSGNVTIGSLGANYYFDGAVDELKLFNRKLSGDDIMAEYNAGVAGQTAGVSLGSIAPGASSSVEADVIALTDANNYSLAINQDHDLTSGAYTIPAMSGGTIASPAAWDQGTTKGLGFTLTDTNATSIPDSWGGGANYAALPNVATSFYTRTGVQTGKDYVRVRLRADIASGQTITSVPYTNTVTITGTYVP